LLSFRVCVRSHPPDHLRSESTGLPGLGQRKIARAVKKNQSTGLSNTIQLNG
jgi:hypothetical protein